MEKEKPIVSKTEARLLQELKTYHGYKPCKGTDMHKKLMRLWKRGLVTHNEEGRFFAVTQIEEGK